MARRGGLIAWGVLLIVVGSLVCLALAAMFLDWRDWFEQSQLRPQQAPRRGALPSPASSSTNFVGALATLAIAAGVLATGIGSCLGRRWTRPVIVIGSAMAAITALYLLVSRLLILPSLLSHVDEAFLQRRRGPSSGNVLSVEAISIGLILVIGVIVPWLMFRFYLNPLTASTLDQTDPRRIWTDRCPIPVLGWIAVCLLTGISLLANLLRPAVPAFITHLTGGPAIIVDVLLGIVLVWAATLCYRQERTGWLVSFFVILLLKGSVASYFWTGGTIVEIWEAMGLSGITELRRTNAIIPDWHAPVMSTLEGAIIVGYGLFASRRLDGSGRAYS